MRCTECRTAAQTYSSVALGETAICVPCARGKYPDRAIGDSFMFPPDVIAHDRGRPEISE